MTPPTRALFVLHTAAPSGAELAALRLMRALAGRGTVEVAAAYCEDGPMLARTREAGIPATLLVGRFDSRAMTIQTRDIRRFAAGLLRLAQLGWRLGDLTRRTGASVLVAESTKALLMAAVASRRARVPLVWHVHDRVSREYFGRWLAIALRVLGWVSGAGLIANSRSTLDQLITWRRPTLVAHPGVDRIEPGPRDPQRPPDRTVVAVVGRLTPWKGQDVFLRAVARLRVRPARVLLVGGTLFGEEAYRSGLQELADELGLPVTFTGHVEDPQEYMRQADVLVHCSVLAEPFGQVVVEGMAAGCAVIASGPGGPAEIVEPEVSGLLVDGGDHRQLTAALDRLLQDRSLRERLAHGGTARAERFAIADAARDVAAFLEQVVGARTGRRGRSHV
ncbi:glycosyltransferase family 4 protein [Blastococcus sp. VKM Ac-2987]|uniref:glycosyltransferase family 4 protein n=1 Tax=Blastococcus sp. VKM Ac-2987 TaxID=3004141 RepID=UPI0022ABA46D|nr:glycosyltransferase family 4 protein [Blastococcus sp. VKM Ac-2987]MCZ2858502.1 glycosyltransferase family 4 protein [Blastococcus sp. VKM Ac-2987]